MMKKIFALASTIGFALTHSHDINIHKGDAIYPPVDFPVNSIVEYYEQAIDFQTMAPKDAVNGYTVVSFYDLNSGRIVDQFGQPAVNTYFRDGKNFKFYQTVQALMSSALMSRTSTRRPPTSSTKSCSSSTQMAELSPTKTSNSLHGTRRPTTTPSRTKMTRTPTTTLSTPSSQFGDLTARSSSSSSPLATPSLTRTSLPSCAKNQ